MFENHHKCLIWIFVQKTSVGDAMDMEAFSVFDKVFFVVIIAKQSTINKEIFFGVYFEIYKYSFSCFLL